jgi:hypothetical protein
MTSDEDIFHEICHGNTYPQDPIDPGKVACHVNDSQRHRMGGELDPSKIHMGSKTQEP